MSPTDKESVLTRMTDYYRRTIMERDHAYLNRYNRAYHGLYKKGYGHDSITGPNYHHPPEFYRIIASSCMLLTKNETTELFENEERTWVLRIYRVKQGFCLVTFTPTNRICREYEFDGLIHITQRGMTSYRNIEFGWSMFLEHQLQLAPDLLRSDQFYNAEMRCAEIRLMNSRFFPGWIMRISAVVDMRGPGKWYLVSFRYNQDDEIRIHRVPAPEPVPENPVQVSESDYPEED
jgi:hypothetical protein